MKQYLLLFLTVSLISIPIPSHAQKGLQLSHQEQLYDSAVRIGVSTSSLNTIHRDLYNTRQAIPDTFTELPSSDKTQVEMVTKTLPLKNVSDAVFQAKLVCEYEVQLLTMLFHIREDDKKHVYGVRKKGLQFSRRSLADCLNRIEEDYDHIDNVLALHLIDKAKEEIRSSLQRIESAIEIIGRLEKDVGSVSE
jgi:hypothetical protein